MRQSTITEEREAQISWGDRDGCIGNKANIGERARDGWREKERDGSSGQALAARPDVLNRRTIAGKACGWPRAHVVCDVYTLSVRPHQLHSVLATSSCGTDNLSEYYPRAHSHTYTYCSSIGLGHRRRHPTQ